MIPCALFRGEIVDTGHQVERSEEKYYLSTWFRNYGNVG